jgi:hypothetical protein
VWGSAARAANRCCPDREARTAQLGLNLEKLSWSASEGGFAVQVYVRRSGLDHGVGHSLLLLYEVKAPNGQKSIEFKDLGHYPSDASLSAF